MGGFLQDLSCFQKVIPEIQSSGQSEGETRAESRKENTKLSPLMTSSSFINQSRVTFAHALPIQDVGGCDCIDTFTKNISEKSLKAWMSIMLTTIKAIMTRPILRLFQGQITNGITQQQASGWDQKKIKSSFVPQISKDGLTIVGIIPAGERPVYDLTIPTHHCFLAEGVVVSNCDAFSLAHQAIHRGMVVDRSAIPKKPRSGRGLTVHTGVGGSLQQRKARDPLDFL
jgi:hypothetical protein